MYCLETRIIMIMQRRSQADQLISLEISWTGASTDQAIGLSKVVSMHGLAGT